MIWRRGGSARADSDAFRVMMRIGRHLSKWSSELWPQRATGTASLNDRGVADLPGAKGYQKMNTGMSSH